MSFYETAHSLLTLRIIWLSCGITAPLNGGVVVLKTLKILFMGWLFLLGLKLIGIPLSAELVGDFEEAPGQLVAIRSWMQISSTTIWVVSIFAMFPIIEALRQLEGHNSEVWRVPYLAHVFSTISLSLALLGSYLVGSGPWLMNAWQMTAFRLFVFLPGIFLSLSAVALAFKINQVQTHRSAALKWSLVCLLTVDSGAGVFVAASTTYAVIPRLHIINTSPTLMLPWCLASLIILAILFSAIQRLACEEDQPTTQAP